jgi:CopG family nickel-responsive transcriptional regulator
LTRSGIRQVAQEVNLGGDCIAAVAYAYDHRERDLAKRLAKSFHDNHDLAVATLQVHLDHDTRMEVSILRGNSHDVTHFAEHVIAERGVRFGRVMIMPAEIEIEKHAHHGKQSQRHLHVHVRKAG